MKSNREVSKKMMNKYFSLMLLVLLPFYINAQEKIETISSGTSGDAILRIEADTDNSNESDNPRIEIKQDGGLGGAYIGFNADWGGSTPDNLFRIGTRYSGVDNFTRFVINPANGNVGIGTTNPAEKLHVNGTTTITADIGVPNSSHWNTGAHTFELQNGDAGDVVMSFHRAGYSNAAIKHTALGGLIFSGSGAFDADHLFLKSNGNVGIGTTIPDSKLTVAGNIHAQEVKVTIGAGADFVFEDDYKLPSLKNLEAFIKTNKHLPEIASEKEMQTNGLLLAEMNIKLLQKIEELTLYSIQQEKQLNTQETQLKTQSETTKKLEDRLLKLEQLSLKK